MKLNEKIYHYRTRAKMSQEQLAAEVGVSRQAVSKWELGDATPEVGKLVSLAKLFGITTDELLSEDDPEEPKAPEPAPAVTYQAAAPEAGAARQEDWLNRLPGFLGNLFRRYGWLAGVYVALTGLGVTVVGGIARFLFGQFFRVATNGFNSLSSLGGGGFTIEGGENLPPEVIADIQNSLGGGAAYGTNTMVGGMGSIFMGFATVVLVVGIVLLIAGVVLAVWLYQRGRRDLQP